MNPNQSGRRFVLKSGCVLALSIVAGSVRSLAAQAEPARVTILYDALGADPALRIG